MLLGTLTLVVLKAACYPLASCRSGRGVHDEAPQIERRGRVLRRPRLRAVRHKPLGRVQPRSGRGRALPGQVYGQEPHGGHNRTRARTHV